MILRMDWLIQHGAQIDCQKKEIVIGWDSVRLVTFRVHRIRVSENVVLVAYMGYIGSMGWTQSS